MLAEHERETGEKVNPRRQLDGEDSSELVKRYRKLTEVDSIRQADRERNRPESGAGSGVGPKETSAAAQKSSRSFRLKGQERDVQRAVSAFEEAEKKLYRVDGSRVFGEEEHTERLGELREEFSERIGRAVSEVEADAKGYEQEARSYTYTDPTKDLTTSERARLDSSRPLVAEKTARAYPSESSQTG